MSDDVIESNMRLRRQALQQAALPAERRIERLKGFDVPFEVADDVHQSSLWVLDNVRLTDEQRSSLVALDRLTDEMSGAHNVQLWTEDALQSHPDWEKVRQLARCTLELFNWPIEDSDASGVEVVWPESGPVDLG